MDIEHRSSLTEDALGEVSSLRRGIDPELILLTGATGYIGGSLLRELEKQGCRLRCMARLPENLSPKVAPSTDVVYGDVLDRTSLPSALEGVKVAYYLIHSMGREGSFEEIDRRAARNFGKAARSAGVERIIYVGGLGDADKSLSPHLRSRQEVGEILRQSGVPVIEFRASLVIGSGSLSFEMIRALVERLPVMIAPKWVSVAAQPIAIEDVIKYLMVALDPSLSGSPIFEIGGIDQVSYAEIMRVYARCRGMRIRMIQVPVLTPYMSSLWLGIITPLYAPVGRKLIESIVNPTVVRDPSALETFDIQPLGIEDAIRQALANDEEGYAEVSWSDAHTKSRKLRLGAGEKFKTRLIDSRTVTVPKPPAIAFKPIQRIGGKTGWYAWNWLWRLRGFLDLLVGGTGMRLGRASADTLQIGDTIDFWRVEEYEPDHFLRLVAEIKLPGRAWLEFEVSGDDSSAEIRQTAIFDPIGLTGRMYWYTALPVHGLVFSGMLRGIAEAD